MSIKPREALLSRYTIGELKEAYQGLSSTYRGSTGGALRTLTDKERAAYLYVRFPATYAVCLKVAEELLVRFNGPVSSMIDFGCGPGTGSMAFSAVFPTLRTFSLVDRDRGFLDIARGELEEFKPQVVSSHLSEFAPAKADLALFSYALNEVDEALWPQILRRAWEQVDTLIVIEPGTKRGFEAILRVRELLLEAGGKIVAPCPQAGACPWKGSSEWCHFSARVERVEKHRLIKEGTLGFEDEKYSYIIITKKRSSPAQFRLMADLSIRKNCVTAKVCTQEGCVRDWVVPKSMSALYKSLKKLSWGDGFDS
jgi:Predicted rRNA methylase